MVCIALIYFRCDQDLRNDTEQIDKMRSDMLASLPSINPCVRWWVRVYSSEHIPSMGISATCFVGINQP